MNSQEYLEKALEAAVPIEHKQMYTMIATVIELQRLNNTLESLLSAATHPYGQGGIHVTVDE